MKSGCMRTYDLRAGTVPESGLACPAAQAGARAAAMPRMRYLFCLSVFFCSVLSSAAITAAEPAAEKAAPAEPVNQNREAVVGARLEQYLPAKTVQWLEADGGKFLTLEAAPKASIEPIGAVMVVSGARRTLADPLVTALREAVVRGGWFTLAVQSPLIAADALPKTVTEATAKLCPRLTAAFAHLKTKQMTKVVVVGLDTGVVDTLACFKEGLPSEVVALTLISGDAGVGDLTLPTLKIMPELGGRELRVSTVEHDERRREWVIAGVDARFAGAEVEVARRLRGWLTHLPPPAPAVQPRSGS